MSHDLNFLSDQQPSHVRQRVFRRQRLGRAGRLVGAIIAILLLWTAAFGVQAALALFEGRTAITNAKEDFESLQFADASDALRRAQDRFQTAHGSLGMIGYLRMVPVLGGEVVAARDALRVGAQASGTLVGLAELGAEMARLSDGGLPEHFSDLSPATKELLLQRLAHAWEDLSSTSAQLATLIADLELEADDRYVWRMLLPLKAHLVTLQEGLQRLSLAAALLPQFGGLDGEKTFLIQFLNNAELRPGGGFLGTYAFATVDRGELVELEVKDSYDLDRLAAESKKYTELAPDPLKRYNIADRWFARDGNWSPDFKESARTVFALMEKEQGVLSPAARASLSIPSAFDGAIGITPNVAQDLLAILGPIQAGGRTFTQENVRDAIQYEVEVGFERQGIPFDERKRILSDLVEQVRERMFSSTLTDLGRVLKVFERELEAGQIVLYSADASTQVRLESLGWAGRVTPGPVDTLVVVDANLASLKTDPVVKRSVAYTMRREGEQLVGTVRVHYEHTGDFDWKTTRYRTFTRVYVPAGSELILVEGALVNDTLQDPAQRPGEAEVTSELGLTSFGAFTSIEPGRSRDLIFTFHASDDIRRALDDREYELRVFKQLGAPPVALTLDLHFGKKIRSATPGEAYEEWGDAVYRLETEVERVLDVRVGL